jgi:murein DD-endopeptidase MepM/ murein hydrolase activator NlpD
LNRLKTILTILVTAVVTAALTSLFWVSAYSHGPIAQDAEAAPAPSQAQGPLVKGPTGLAIPVVGVKAASLVDTYSQARAGGARIHDAIDIMAPEGTPVIAAAPGKVEKLYFSNGGGGITIYVRSDDGHWTYYYAHLHDYAPGLAEGQNVKQGTLLGHVGHTGNASADGPHLHFAINRMEPGDGWWKGAPINPYPLLAAHGAAR